ncbi:MULTISPECIES: CHAT domain-containing tetratricopeptide repeat protein [unclassified Microcoleus]|uniref:CHAT domain-containing protein n=1 Tax=unclassified Microcoleus TaxID=2642155 RepID=UPI0025FAB931|nr:MULTISPECIES: CHAT domain-containing tetratricopeptide repeat protein [unclassified Microcoleus]
MDENRVRAYLNLIQLLLSCPSGEEGNVLQEHSEFVDSGLIEVMQEVASRMAADGEENAGFLQQLAGQISQALAQETQGGNADRNSAYLQLINALLSCPSGEEPQILQDNSQLLDAGFLQACEAVAATLAAEGEDNQANYLLNLAREVGEFLGFTSSERNNFENISPRDYLAFLQLLVQTEQNNFGGDTHHVYAVLQANIDKLNLNFIPLFQQTMTGLLGGIEDPKEAERVAAFIENIGIKICQFPRGNRAENLEISIATYEIVLSVRTFETKPEQWAQTQNNLGNVYVYRIRGERADNIEKAILCYQDALKVRTRDTFPTDWATTQNNLAAAYYSRIRGKKADNIERAIASFTEALEVRTSIREEIPEQWAQTQNNLGEAYRQRIKGERADNIEQAIAYYTAALEVYTHEEFPEQRAQTQNNLGEAYRQRIKGEPEQNIEQAIVFYNNALEVFTHEEFPEQWATTLNNLAITYLLRIRGERAENIEQGLTSFTAALKVCTREAFPQNHAETLFNLGIAYRKVPNLQLAHDTFAEAINTVELLRSEIHSGDETKQKLAEEWNKLYRNMVEVCIELKNYTEAIEYAERSKARNLVELLATRDFYPKGDIPETVINQLSRLRREIDTEQRRVDIEQTNRNNNGGRISGERSPQIDNLQTTIRDQTNLTQLRQQLNELIDREIKPIDPDFALTQEVKGISYSDIQSLTAENTAILQWYITSDRLLAFIITPESPTPIVWQSSKTDFKALENWFNEYLKDYQENKTQWQQNLASRLQSLADILHLNDLLGRVAKQCSQLILIPHRYLHLLPLHALPVSRETWQRFNSETPSPEPTNPCLLDCFKQSVRYAPSCQLLQQAQRRERPNFTHLFAVQNPNNNLPFTDIEVPAIRQNFPAENQDILIQNNAIKSAINDNRLRIAHCAHFSCHGYFNFQQPLLSALQLADSELPPPAPAESNPNRYQPLENGNILDLDKCLTLADIFALDFRECRLVVLSACETGISDFKSISDEYISLPSGFLVAGSSSVVPTLWAVNDLSTSLLMIEFYQNLKAGLSVALALNKAQLWLRDVTVEKLQQWTSKLSIRPSLKEDLYDMLDHLDSTEQPPFRSHYHWAAFCATGQ